MKNIIIMATLVALLSGCTQSFDEIVQQYRDEIPDCPYSGFAHYEIHPYNVNAARRAFQLDGWSNIRLDEKEETSDEMEADCLENLRGPIVWEQD